MSFNFTPDEEEQIFRELGEQERRISSHRATSSQNLARTVGDLYRMNPDVNPGVIVSASRAVLSGAMTREQYQKLSMDLLRMELDDAVSPRPKEENKSWWERNVAGPVTQKLKTGSRWTIAGLMFPHQYLTGAAAQFFDEDENAAGWFISTDLGSLIENQHEAGDGFFIGGRAAELQGERARRYRGELGGKAWTIGRGTASLISQPGSREFGIISGMIDLALAIKVPVFPGSQAVSGAVKAGAADVGLTRSLAGLAELETGVIRRSKVKEWLDSSQGQRVIDRVAKIETIDEAIRIFPKVQDTNFWVQATDLKNPGQVRTFLDETLGLVGPKNIKDINIGRFSDVVQNNIGERFSYIRRMMQKMPGQHLVIAAENQRDAAASITSLNNYLKLLQRYGKKDAFSDTQRIDLVERFARAVNESNGDVYQIVEEFDVLLRNTLLAQGVPEQAIGDLTKGLKQFRDNPVYGYIDDLGDPSDLGASLFDDTGELVNGLTSTAVLESEALKTALMLPDPRRVRRMLSEFDWVFGRGTIKTKFSEFEKLNNQAARLRNLRPEQDGSFLLDGKRLTQKQVADELNKIDARLEKIGKTPEQISELRKKANRLRTLEPDANGRYIVDGKALNKTQVQRLIDDINDTIAESGGTRLVNPEKYGELRMPLSAIEFFQNEMWKPIVLATGGYALRNMTESAIRQGLAPGLRSGVFHPLEWIQIAVYKKFRGDINGNPFKGTADELLANGQEEFARAVGASVMRELDPVSAERMGFRKNVWKRVRRSDGKDYRKGLQDEVSLLADDAAASLVASGLTNDEIIDLMRTDPRMKNYVKGLQNRWKNRTVYDGDGNRQVRTIEIVRADGSINEANLNEFLNKYIRRRIQRVTGNDQRLISLIASNGEFVELADGTRIKAFRTGAGGKRVSYSDEFTRVADDIVADTSIQLKGTYKSKVEVDAAVDARYRGRQRNQFYEGMDKATDTFFGQLYPKREAFLNRSPAFRKFYYQQIDNLMDELAPGEAQKIINNLREAARDAGVKFTDKWAAQYLGDATKDGKSLYSKILAKAEGRSPSTGNLSHAEISAYAKGYALDETQKLFYNVSQTANFADIFRIIAPFGSAWAEIMSGFVRLSTNNPENLRRLGVSVKGLRDADPDGDGKGFFWRDPQTGEYVFNYPFSEKLGPLASYLGGMGALAGGVFGGVRGAAVAGAAGVATGLVGQRALDMEGLTLQAPVRSLSMGLNILPGLGPMAQIPANRILGQIPQLDDLRRMLTPYGEPQLTLAPSWMQKVFSALSSPDNNRLLGDMMIDTMRVLSSTGEYDLSRPEDVEALENDALSKARGLLVLRALGQFTGPSRPTVEFKTETFQGDMFMGELSKAFRDMQQQNYDTAVERFLFTFGEDAFLYIAGKTKAASGGLDASTEFGKFERANQSLFNRHGDVAGYFAPVGTNFDYQVYLRQLQTGARTKLSPRDLVEEAQSLVGRALYRSTVQMAGPNPSREQQDYLRNIRKLLQKRFPGYATTPIDINKLPAQIEQLQRAVNDPILNDNRIAQAAKLYFDVRTEVLAEALARGYEGLSGKAVADLRAYLRDVGASLSRRIPEFERLYDRVLFNEIDIDAGDF